MQNKWYGDSFKLGMLGGGQLGRMFIQEAINFDLHVHVMDPDPEAPCKAIAHSFTCGSLNDYDTVLNFGKDKAVLTVEIENVNVEALEALEKAGVKVFPQPSVLKTIKDKGTQKQFFIDNNIPTAPFQTVAENESLENFKHFLPFVQKLRTGGYDGKGVQTIHTTEDFKKGFSEPSIIEEMIPFTKELAVIVARNSQGEIAVYPTVECEFSAEANLVEFLFAPADVTSEIEEKAQSIAIDVIQKLDMVGILAVEFFLTKAHTLLVNEIAPRPHNSGHHTIECNTTSQFEQHLRSILNLHLGDTKTIQAGAMINLLGESGFEGKVVYDGLYEYLGQPGIHPHLYGKSTTKPFRKMGHITIAGPTLSSVKKLAIEVKNAIRVIAE